jgi:hypothetical protein
MVSACTTQNRISDEPTHSLQQTGSAPDAIHAPIHHLQEHRFHVAEIDRLLARALESRQNVQLPRGDLVGLDGALLSEERAHVPDKGACGGWYL